MASLTRIEVFLKVAEMESFSDAANLLSVTPAAVSKSIKILEEEIGVQLLRRTTRSVKLTEDGLIFFERCKRAMTDLEEAEDEITSKKENISGTLRIDMPIAFGHIKMIQALTDFAKAYPKIQIEASLNESMTNLDDENIDVAIRLGQLNDSAFVSRKLGSTKYITCATPGYLKTHGVPKSPKELLRHECIHYLHPRTRLRRTWHFITDEKVTEIDPPGQLGFTTGEGVLRAALTGCGIINVHDYIVDKEIKSGQLKAILTRFTPPETQISALYLKHRYLSAKIRTFVNFLGKAWN